MPAKPGHWHLGYTPISLHMFSQGIPKALIFSCKRTRTPRSLDWHRAALVCFSARNFDSTWMYDFVPFCNLSKILSHCNSAETCVFSLTHVTNASLGHGLLGSWQYLTMQARLSSAEAGMPAKPGHWHFGYAPISLHMFSHGIPMFPNLSWSNTRRAWSRFSHDAEACRGVKHCKSVTRPAKKHFVIIFIGTD